MRGKAKTPAKAAKMTPARAVPAATVKGKPPIAKASAKAKKMTVKVPKGGIAGGGFGGY